MNPRKYNLTSVTNPETGKRVTNAKRQKAYRLRKSGHTEEACPVCSKTWFRPNSRCVMFDNVTIVGAAHKAKSKEFDRLYARLYAFTKIKDYEKAKAAFRRAMQETHPDHGGDPERAKDIIIEWNRTKNFNGWDQRPIVTEIL
jgi:hypothetical protein